MFAIDRRMREMSPKKRRQPYLFCPRVNINNKLPINQSISERISGVFMMGEEYASQLTVGIMAVDLKLRPFQINVCFTGEEI